MNNNKYVYIYIYIYYIPACSVREWGTKRGSAEGPSENCAVAGDLGATYVYIYIYAHKYKINKYIYIYICT